MFEDDDDAQFEGQLQGDLALFESFLSGNTLGFIDSDRMEALIDHYFSEGDYIKAKRAAEADAYRRLGERLMGVKINSNTTVRDLALKNDKVIQSMAGLLKGADVTAIQFQKDLSCEVTMQVKLSEVIRTVTRVVKGRSSMEDSIETKTVTETGRGAASSEPAAGPSTEYDSEFTEVQISETLRRVVSETPVNN
jgi:hypothetical protein